jgi:hypothetical protein
MRVAGESAVGFWKREESRQRSVGSRNEIEGRNLPGDDARTDYRTFTASIKVRLKRSVVTAVELCERRRKQDQRRFTFSTAGARQRTHPTDQQMMLSVPEHMKRRIELELAPNLCIRRERVSEFRPLPLLSLLTQRGHSHRKR